MVPMLVEDAWVVPGAKRVRSVLVDAVNSEADGLATGVGGTPVARQSARPGLDRDKVEVPLVAGGGRAAAGDRLADPSGGSGSQLG